MKARMVALLLTLAIVATADDKALRDELGRDYFVYAPDPIEPHKTYWLVVGVHGAGGDGRGAGGLAPWVRNGDCIVVGPSFPNQGYQYLQKDSDVQLVKLFASLSSHYKLEPKLFIHGFSGGAQFAHRFMLKHPQLVAGCSAHSGGTWATSDEWSPAVDPRAASVPLVISCGKLDAALAHPSLPLGRMQWAEEFERRLAAGGFSYEAQYWPGVGHQESPGVDKMTRECYRLATAVLPKIERATAEAIRRRDAGNPTACRTALADARKLLPPTTSDLSKRIVERQLRVLKEVESSLASAGPKE